MLTGGLVTGGDGTHRPGPAAADRYAAPGRDVDYRLTGAGREALADLGVTLAAPGSDGTLGLRYCVDWTEQRHHLAGTVGRSLASRLDELGWLRRADHSRAVHVTPLGEREFARRFGVRL
jgi:hypothetical protein